LDWEGNLILDEVLLDTTFLTDLMFTSVKGHRLFILLLFRREKHCSYTSCWTSQSFFTQYFWV